MTNLISKTIAGISNLFKELQVKRFVAVVLVGFLVLTTSIGSEHSSKAVTESVKSALNQNDSQRPKTTGEWNREARETEGAPGERAKRIVGQSAEAIKDFGSVYPDTAKRTAE
ncbi:hypothetical protein G7B40_029650 [Aetokthonos hydrillicola Thurmond2011]|jgi:hypothetical protein|uniref:Uncharacterized protein n=1 Tax=Aetokthonos hydrillicola Thurmond2011 TaxID=2712845 RepID=A0AAP5IBY3_9CYAN|nr:hypothetical protein [Aetokthonos hydrillicola]MBO3461981.1 hypothetical protein [Aetokthonos hydrillicola CCALA 1050]MBW4589133.1 hypothetical protein [Aetokthonos hydrillicola CCALA 1050]MDR9898691.1 hypothetical protein [Aetokthonos hydrillicola Thurmond2011]